LVVTGGVGISENMNLGGNINCSGATSTLTTNTLSTTTGSGTLVVTGGVGIGGNINVGGSTSKLTGNTPSISTGSGTLVVTGGVGISGDLNVGGATCKLSSNTPSISTGTGTLVVTGGVGIGENLFVNNQITAKNITANYITIEKDTTNNTNGILTLNSGRLLINNTNDTAVTVTGRGNFDSLAVTKAVTAASFNATSDYRIKTSITDLDPTFTTDHLRPVKYTNINDKKEYIGFIAHEIQQTYPYLVTGEKDGEETQTMNYDGIIGILVNEIKMLKQRICILENK
jgi:hypothetical protein